MHRDRPSTAKILLLLAGTIGGVQPALAQSSQHRTVLLDLRLGTAAADLPDDAFIDYACGTNGGPPGRALNSFLDFALCPPEPSGLHEVAFSYDDELEYRALARGDLSGAEVNGGTTISSYPVYASALFDDAGILRGLRAVTDDRIELRARTNAYLMPDVIHIQFGRDGWDCIDRRPEKGQEPLAGQYVDQSCSKTVDGMLIYTEAHLFRRAGQTEVNRDTGDLNRGQFESTSRLDIRAAGAPVDARGRPL